MTNDMKLCYHPRLRKGQFFEIDNTTVFIDIVDFAERGQSHKMMRRAVRSLNDTINDVLGQYEWDLEEKGTYNDIILNPTGDGYLIAFSPTIRDVQILEHVKNLFLEIRSYDYSVRIGINKGPNLIFLDLNQTLNIIGWGVVYSQRVLSIAEKNQILCTESFAKPLIDSHGVKDLHYISDFPTKHGIKIHVYNYFKNGEFGNQESPKSSGKRC